MGLTFSQARRIAARRHRRPDLEALEIRTLLSISTSTATPTLGSLTVAGAGTTALLPSTGTPFDSIVGASAARATYNVNGSGMTVAVIDAGVNYDNSALGGGFGPGSKVVAGYDFADGTSDPIATTMQHGTAVAGLIASDAPGDLGIAPGADIVALKVFNSQNQAGFNNVASALQWVINNHSQYNITDVNLSLSDGGNYAQNWFASDGSVGQELTSLIGQLDSMNIPVVAAAGNSFSGQQGMGFPSIIPDTISVTATDGNGELASDAQRLGSSIGGDSATDLSAPGVNDEAPQGGNSVGLMTGTSFAAPIVSGAVVLMQQVYQSRFGQLPTVSQIDGWLKAGSDPINDPSTGLTIGQLDIPNALAQIPNPAQETLIPPTSGSTSSTTVASSGSSTPVIPVTTPPPSAPVSPTPSTPVTSTPAPTTTTSTPVTSPPAQSTTPPTTTTTTTTTTTSPPAQSTSTSTTTLTLNGQTITNADLASPSSGKLEGLPSWLVTAVNSLKNWWNGSSGNNQVQLWVASQPATGQAAGKAATPIKHVATPVKHVAAPKPTVVLKTVVHPAAKVFHESKVVPHAVHTFAGARRHR